jgi:hypothetical protein
MMAKNLVGQAVSPAKASEARLRWQECQRGRQECLRHIWEVA